MLSRLPQLGVGGWTPRPRKLSAASRRTFVATARLDVDEQRRDRVRQDVAHDDRRGRATPMTRAAMT